MNNKQKKIVIVVSLISLIAGAGVFAYFKIKEKGIKIKFPVKYSSSKKKDE